MLTTIRSAADQLVLEQFAQRGLVIEHRVGCALRVDRRLVGGEAAFAERRGIDHASPRRRWSPRT
ncbi:MAG: hypothetical protein V9G20_30105 [Candidatus Promineifilaceae bacterium]